MPDDTLQETKGSDREPAVQNAVDRRPQTKPETKPQTRPQTVLILGLALGMRLLVLLAVLTRYPAGWLFTRGMEMGLLAKSILAGHGLGSPFGPPTGPTAFIAPVYPILIAAVFRLFGIETVASAVVILTLQTLLNLLAVWLILRIAHTLFNATAANIAGAIWACSLPLIWLPTIFWETSISVCLLLGLVLLTLRCLCHSTTKLWLAIGAYCGVAGLTNPALLPTLLAVTAWTAFCTRRQSRRLAPDWTPASSPAWAPLCALLLGLIVFSPWPIRNARTFHAFIPTRTTVGFELWMGNYPGASGYLEESLFPSFNAHELADYRTMGEVAYTDRKATLARQLIMAYPVQFLRLTVLRVLRFWSGSGSRGGSPLYTLHAATTTLFGLAGLWLLFRSGRVEQAVLFLLPLTLFPFPYYITHAEFRYRIVIDPLLAILTGYCISHLLSKGPIHFDWHSTEGYKTQVPFGNDKQEIHPAL